MKDRAIEFKVGLLVLVALGLLGALIFTLGNFSLAKGGHFFVDFGFVGNLHEGAPVKISGIRVGKVQSVEFRGGETDPQTGRRVYVRLRAWVEEKARKAIHRDAELYINTQGVLGEQYLEVVPGSPGKPAIAVGDVLLGVSPPRADLIVSRLFDFLDAVTKLLSEDRETISNLLRASAKAIKTIDVLLVENEGQIKRLLANLEQFTAETTALVTQVRAGVGDPRRLSRMLANVEHATASLAREIDPLLNKSIAALDGVARVGKSVGPDEQKKIRRLIDRLATLGDRAFELSGDARVLVQRLVKGKGTAGALLAREELYDDVKEMVRDLKRNPWKFLWRE